MTIVVGLGFGDEGKGTTVDFLARETGAPAVVRFGSGPQAGHNVVTDDGRWHCFAQLGAGTFAGAATVLGPGMVVELEALAAEADAVAGKGVPDALARMTIDPRCALVTPMHKLVGQLRELAAPRGSCGMGVGEAIRWRDRGLAATVGALDRASLQALADEAARLADALFGALADEPRDVAGAFRLRAIHERVAYFAERCQPDVLLDTYRGVLDRVTVGSPPTDGAIFEGAQGALLDRDRGFIPHVTQSRTTSDAANAPGPRIGVLRAYHHRHGAGPFVTEQPGWALADPYNRENRWQGRFRVGDFDLVAARYALTLDRVDALAITGLDRLDELPETRACIAYRYAGDPVALEGLVDHDGPEVAALQVPRDPGAAARLTIVLAHCQPSRWLDLPRDPRRWIATIERELGVPVAIASSGPTWRDKVRIGG